MPQFLENVLRAISSAEKYYLVPKYWNDALLSYELRKTKGSENVLPMFKRTYRNGNFICTLNHAGDYCICYSCCYYCGMLPST